MAQNIPNLLRPGQVDALKAEASRLEFSLTQPHLQDRPAATRALRHTQSQLDKLIPQEYPADQIDKAVRRASELRTEMIEDGMPTRMEMRANMPGAVGKLRRWERRNKTKLQEWKYHQLRLNPGSDDPDVANFERFRPSGGSGELSRDNAQIEGQNFFFGPNAGKGPATVLNDAEINVLKEVAPDTAAALPLLDGEMRAELRDIVRGLMEEQAFSASAAPVEAATAPSAKKAPKARKKAEWSPERRKAFGESMKAAREAKKAKAA